MSTTPRGRVAVMIEFGFNRRIPNDTGGFGPLAQCWRWAYFLHSRCKTLTFLGSVGGLHYCRGYARFLRLYGDRPSELETNSALLPGREDAMGRPARASRLSHRMVLVEPWQGSRTAAVRT